MVVQTIKSRRLIQSSPLADAFFVNQENAPDLSIAKPCVARITAWYRCRSGNFVRLSL